MKTQITNITGSGFYKESDPSKVFIAIKTPGYWPIFVGQGISSAATGLERMPAQIRAHATRSSGKCARKFRSSARLFMTNCENSARGLQKARISLPGGDYQATPMSTPVFAAVVEAFVRGEWFETFVIRQHSSSGKPDYQGGDLSPVSQCSAPVN